MTTLDALKRAEVKRLHVDGWRCPMGCCREEETSAGGSWKVKTRRYGRRKLKQLDRLYFQTVDLNEEEI